MKDIFKKIIVLTYITFILISFFTPFNLSFAQDESGQCTPPKKLIGGYCVDPLGTCTYSDGTKTSPIVRSVCENKEGRMGLDGKIKQGTWAEAPSTSSQENTYYQLLEPLPCDKNNDVGSGSGPGCVYGKLESIDPTKPDAFGKYINEIIILLIGICAVLAVVMIVIGGIEY